MIEIYIPNLQEMQKFAEDLAQKAKQGDVITLNGDLGAGKTTFTQFFVEAIAQRKIEVTSPTFNLLHIYETNRCEIWHFDLYRLKHKEEIYELGIEDALMQGISIIEWPQIILNLLPRNRLDIYIEFSEESQARIIRYEFLEKNS